MNKFTILLLTITIYAVSAEPLRNRQQQFRQFSRQEATTTEQEETTDDVQSTPSNGPYAPSGWKPSGQLLVLPSRQQQQQQQYIPPQQYGPPTTEYGAPDNDADVSSTAEASDASDSNETTDEPDSESVEDGPQEQANFNQQPQQQTGYFVQLADGSIQQVLYVAPATVGAKLQVQPAVQAQPLFVQPYYAPQAVSFTSQYQSW